MSTEIVSVSDDANCDDAPQEKTGLFAFDWSTWISNRKDSLEATIVRALVLLKKCG
jgi:hypothetical protein